MLQHKESLLDGALRAMTARNCTKGTNTPSRTASAEAAAPALVEQTRTPELTPCAIALRDYILLNIPSRPSGVIRAANRGLGLSQ
jgi:hypothetical protein